MSNSTTRLSMPYPEEFEDPFWESFRGYVEAVDSWVAAVVADRNVVIRGGGRWSFNATTGVLSWDDAIEIWQLVSGFKTTIEAGSVTLAEGAVAFVDLARTQSGNNLMTLTVASATGSSQGKWVVAFRQNQRVFLRGKVLVPGSPVQVFEETGRRVGSLAFAAASIATATLTPALPDALYRVIGLTPYGASAPPAVPVITAKSTTEFTVTVGGSWTGVLEYEVVS